MKVQELVDFIKRMSCRSGKKSANLKAETPILFINKDGEDSYFYFQFDEEKDALLLIECEEE